MRLTVNGEIIEKSNAGTVMELLHELQIEPLQVAVEVNLSIIKKADYSTFRLNDGDKVEIVKFVGGGCEYKGRGIIMSLILDLWDNIPQGSEVFASLFLKYTLWTIGKKSRSIIIPLPSISKRRQYG